MICTSFDEAEAAFIEGDPRKLASYVEHHDLTDYEAKFVAQALRGEINTKDGRSEKPWVLNLFYDYYEILRGGELKNRLFGAKQKITQSEIHRALADMHGYADQDAVKKALQRLLKRRSGTISPKEYIAAYQRCKDSGRAWPIRSEREAVEHLNAFLHEPLSKIVEISNRDTIKK